MIILTVNTQTYRFDDINALVMCIDWHECNRPNYYKFFINMQSWEFSQGSHLYC
jgi:hypothetical protein